MHTPMPHLKTASIILFSTALSAFVQLQSAKTAYAASCSFPTTQQPTLNLQRLDGKVRYNNNRTQNSLKRMQQKNGQSTAFGNAWIPVGRLESMHFQMLWIVHSFAAYALSYFVSYYYCNELSHPGAADLELAAGWLERSMTQRRPSLRSGVAQKHSRLC